MSRIAHRTSSARAIPAMDTDTKGRLPFLVKVAQRTRPSAIATQLVVERAPLTDGIPVMWRDFGDQVRVAYDPKQMSDAQARATVIIRVSSARQAAAAR